MQIVKTDKLNASQKEALVKIWNDEYPEHLSYKSVAEFEDYLAKLGQPMHYLALSDSYEIAGWLGVFNREGERWIVLLIDNTQQRQGLGTRLIENAKNDEHELNGWVIDHDKDLKANRQNYRSPLGFYQHNGFTILEDKRLELNKLSAVKIHWTKSNK